MKMLQRFTASAALALIMGTACFGQHYTRINLVSNTAGAARVTDPQLINPWGISRSPGSAWWVSNQKTGISTVYNGAGEKQSLIVGIPRADPNNKNTPTGTPTGAIFNSSQTDFLLAPGTPARFLFSTIDGTIAGWNPNVAVSQGAAPPSTQAVTVVKTTDGSSYTGLTSAFIDGKPYLYAANFAKARVDVYDSTFHRVKLPTGDIDGDCSDYLLYCSQNAFKDENLPRPYAPFNVQAIGNDIVVTYAIYQQQVAPLEADGPGLGFVDIYSSTGQLLLRLQHGDWLNAPWGVALAPADFGRFSDNLLIGQFAGGGDTQSSGYIAAYDLTTGKFTGLLQDVSGEPLVIKGIWALSPGNFSRNTNDSTGGRTAQVYFTAGPGHGSGGLFGYLTPVSTEDHLEEISLWTPRSATDIHAHISSTPAGAHIQVDGKYVGATPADIDLTCWSSVRPSERVKSGGSSWDPPRGILVPKNVRTLLDARLCHPCKWEAAARWEPLPQPSTSIVECGGNSDRLARISLELSSLSPLWQTARWKSDPLDSGLRHQDLSKIWPSRADTGTTPYSACSLLTEL